jgi:hypothetical protein
VIVFYIKRNKLYAIVISEAEKRVKVYDVDEKKLVADKQFERTQTRKGLLEKAMQLIG